MLTLYSSPNLKVTLEEIAGGYGAVLLTIMAFTTALLLVIGVLET
jgi:hypothetical protein